MRVALIRYHETSENTRQLGAVQQRAGLLPHLGLGYIHSALEQAGHEVLTLDAQVLQLSDAGLRQELRRFQPALAGVTTTTPGLHGALQACRIAKECGARVILGGPHTEIFGVANLHHPFLDFVGCGEGCSIMPELAAALDAGRPPEDVPGVVTRERPVSFAPIKTLAELGWPNRTAIPIGCYRSILAKRPFTTMISSRGCPYRCSFCFKQNADLKPAFREPEDVVAEMAHLVRQWGVREIMFYDDVFTMKRERVMRICERIRGSGLRVRWEAPTRVNLVDEELLRAMAQAGCTRLRFGIEAGDEELLRAMRKETDIGAIRAALAAAKRAGLQTFAYFIVGYLGETPEQFRRTVDLACDLPLDYAAFYTATPLPGTALHREAVDAGLIDAGYWPRFVRGETHDRVGFLVDDAEARARWAYRRFYFRPAKLGAVFRRVTGPLAAWNVSTGLLSLARSRANAARDV